jgi:hypothetical protein
METRRNKVRFPSSEEIVKHFIKGFLRVNPPSFSDGMVTS